MTAKKYDYAVTVLTPAYNRGVLLRRLYTSLMKQTNKNFQWLIIDDGSTDDTKEIVTSFCEAPFSLEYHYKENGGKHTALNYSHPFIRGELVIIVDSDDYLTEDAIDTIISDWKKYRNDVEIAGFSFLKMRQNGHILSKTPPRDYYISDFIHYRTNQNIGGDQCEVTRTDVFKEFPFPVYSNERFMSEGILWRAIGRKYKTIYRSKPIYICEYLEGGLTKSGRAFRMKNPYGMMENCRSFFYSEIVLSIKLKEAILYDVYALCTKEGMLHWIKTSGAAGLCLMALPLGMFFYKKWAP